MKPCIIKQPAGIGDVFFCQKIAHYMVHHGFDVIWPLRPDIAWIGDYIKGYGIFNQPDGTIQTGVWDGPNLLEPKTEEEVQGRYKKWMKEYFTEKYPNEKIFK